jgi:hypothetical protein
LGEDVRRVLLGEGLLATSLSFSELTWLCRLNRSCRFITYFREAWRGVLSVYGVDLSHVPCAWKSQGSEGWVLAF